MSLLLSFSFPSYTFFGVVIIIYYRLRLRVYQYLNLCVNYGSKKKLNIPFFFLRRRLIAKTINRLRHIERYHVAIKDLWARFAGFCNEAKLQRTHTHIHRQKKKKKGNEKNRTDFWFLSRVNLFWQIKGLSPQGRWWLFISLCLRRLFRSDKL